MRFYQYLAIRCNGFAFSLPVVYMLSDSAGVTEPARKANSGAPTRHHVAFDINTPTDTCTTIPVLHPGVLCLSPAAVLQDWNDIAIAAFHSARVRLCLADLQAPWTVPVMRMTTAIPT